MLGTPELLIIAGVVVLVFGAKRIPELFGGVGKGIKEFKKGLNEDENTQADPAIHGSSSSDDTKNA